MDRIRKTSNVVSLGKKEKAGGSEKTSPVSETASPFAANPLETLKAITGRQSRPMTEEEKLRLLQNALKDFAAEARKHLPKNLGDMEKKVRSKMLAEGFSEEVAAEAGDETVTAILDNSVKRTQGS